MKLENWSFVGATNNFGLFSPEILKEGSFKVWGKVYGSDKFSDGMYISTSAISEFENSTVTTKSGSIYELGEMNSDYAKFNEAVHNNIPILKNWSFDGSPEKKVVAGTLYMGNNVTKDIHATITAINSDDNIYTLSTGDKIFIDWVSTSVELRHAWRLKFRNLSEFANMKAKINF